MLPKGEPVAGSPTDIYTRVARGVLNCWFGASGPLKSGYIYHAEAAPPSKGGRSEIVIRVRDKAAADPRSLRAYRVLIAAGDTGSLMEIENVTISEPLASSLSADVRRWAQEQEGCSVAPTAAAPPPAATHSPPAKSDKAPSKKKAGKAVKTAKPAKK